MKQIMIVKVDDKERIWIELDGTDCLASRTLIFYLASELRLYQDGETLAEPKKKLKELVNILMIGKNENHKLREELNI